MKKQNLLKAVLILLIMNLHVVCKAQQEYYTPESGGFYDANDDENSDFTVPDEMFNSAEVSLNDAIESTLKAAELVKEESEKAAKLAEANEQKRYARPGTPTDAPPDCPECVPDPGGDVPDVPFDKRLLFLLMTGAVVIVIKNYAKPNMESISKGDIVCV